MDDGVTDPDSHRDAGESGDARSSPGEDAMSTGGDAKATGGDAVAANGDPVKSNGEPVTRDGEPVTSDGEPVAGDGDAVTTNGESASTDRATVPTDGEPVAATGTTGAPDAGPISVDGSRSESGFTTVEPWSPPTPDGDDSVTVREYLTAGESLQTVDGVRDLSDVRGPATAALTDERLLVVGPDGGFVGVGLDRICAVRSHVRTSFDVRGTDYRVPLGLGYLLAIVGLVGVLGAATNPLTPTLALVTLGAVLATDHVRRTDGAYEPGALPLDPRSRAGGVVDRLERLKRRFDERFSDDAFVLGATSGLAVGPFLILAAIEGGLLVPALTLLMVAGVALSVYAFRHSAEFDEMELVRRRQRQVNATLDDGRSVVVRTRPDSTLDRRLAGVAGTRSTRRRAATADD